MKKIIIFFSLALLLGFGVNAQTLSTDTFNTTNANLPAVGSNFDVPVDITGIGEIFSLTVYFEYDNTILNYIGFANAMVTNTVIDATVVGVIKVTAAAVAPFTPVTFPDGKLLDLQFDFRGGDSDLTFWTTTYGTYPSSIFHTNFSTEDFTTEDVTNGSVDGDFYYATISGGDWDTGSNWSTGSVPNAWANVTVASGTETISGAGCSANRVTIEPGGELSCSSTLDIAGDFTIQSNASGSGSFIDNGTLTVGGTTSADCYVASGRWHGISAPVSGEDFNSMWLP